MKVSLVSNIMWTEFFGFQETPQTACGQASGLLLNIETISRSSTDKKPLIVNNIQNYF
jgi:hypothetical protein